MKRGIRGRGNRIDAPGNPAVKIIFIREAANSQRGIVSSLDGEGLALLKAGAVVFMQNRDMTFQSFDGASVVIIVQPEAAPAVRFHRDGRSLPP